MDLAIVAGRVSTRDQADKGFSLPEQVSAGLAYIQERGYQLADVPGFSNVDGLPAQPGAFIEDYTGMSMDRPALDAMRDLVKQRGIRVIVFTETDRLARKRIYGDLLELEFEELGARVEYAIERFADSDEGRLFKGIKRELAEYERLKILRRMRTGKAGRCKSGKVLIADRAPYGYRRSDDGKALVIFADEARIIVLIFTWYIEGLSTYAIAARLNETQAPGYAGPLSRERRRGWRDTHISDILACETYTGVWYYNKSHTERKNGKYVKKTMRDRSEWIGVRVPAIIDADTFALARAQAERNKVNASRNRKRDYLFSGMLRCEACGWTYVGSAHRQRYPYYHCRQKFEKDQHGNRLCWMPNYSEADLDAAIWPWLTGILREPERALQEAWERTWKQFADEQAQATLLHERLARMDARLADVRRRIANLDDEVEVESDDERRSALRERVARHIKTRHDLEAERASLAAQIAQQPPASGNGQYLFDLCDRILHEAEPATPATKRDTYERVRLQVRLETRGGLKLAHVSCTVGEETLTVGHIAAGALWCCRG